MVYEQIKYEVSEGILTITLNRPQKLNAFTAQMRDELIDAMDRADADDSVRVIIFTGEGRAFCAGSDLKEGGSTFDYSNISIDSHRDEGGTLTLRIYESKKPVIAAINGPAVGVGITMTLSMDIRIASDKAKMGFVFVRRGIVAEACSGWFLPRIVGMSQAQEWVCTGRIFSAEEALAGRLISRVVSAEDLLPTARSIALEIAQNTAPVSVALARQLLLRMQGADHPMESHRIESRMMYWLGQQADAREGITSFLEKRLPDYTMKPSTDMPPFYPWWPDRPFKK